MQEITSLAQILKETGTAGMLAVCVFFLFFLVKKVLEDKDKTIDKLRDYLDKTTDIVVAIHELKEEIKIDSVKRSNNIDKIEKDIQLLILNSNQKCQNKS